MGPGTHVDSNVRKGVQPTSYLDGLSMVHDVNYLLATGDPELLDRADDLALERATRQSLSIQRSLFIAGLKSRKLLQIKTKEGLDDKAYYIAVGLKLKDIILNSQEYSDVRSRYELTDRDFLY